MLTFREIEEGSDVVGCESNVYGVLGSVGLVELFGYDLIQFGNPWSHKHLKIGGLIGADAYEGTHTLE